MKRNGIGVLTLLLASQISLQAWGANEACSPAGSKGEDPLAKTCSALQQISQEIALTPDLPDPQALGPWKEVVGYVDSRVDLRNYSRLSVKCADKNLYPTHPQQTLKLYHLFNSAQYDARKLKGDSEACNIAQKSPEVEKRRCLAATMAENAILSDTYQDSCGNYYRGFVHTYFLKKNESMGSLFSRGRAVYDKPNKEFGDPRVHDTFYGSTYSTPESDFVFLGPLLPGDKESIEVNRKRAEATHTFDPKTHLFIEKKQP